MISAIFVESKGCYQNDDRIDPWDIVRDGRKYDKLNPVIAHPPCQKWGKMARVNFARWGGEHNKPEQDEGCFKSALKSLHLCGGVLEHPAQSYAWEKFGIAKPKRGMWIETLNGWTCEVWQSAYGHRANKATWLYYVGSEKPFELNWDRPKGSHQVGFQDQRGKARNKPTLNKKEANATPTALKELLIQLAEWSVGISVTRTERL
jgi:hypothetical protein